MVGARLAQSDCRQSRRQSPVRSPASVGDYGWANGPRRSHAACRQRERAIAGKRCDSARAASSAAAVHYSRARIERTTHNRVALVVDGVRITVRSFCRSRQIGAQDRATQATQNGVIRHSPPSRRRVRATRQSYNCDPVGERHRTQGPKRVDHGRGRATSKGERAPTTQQLSSFRARMNKDNYATAHRRFRSSEGYGEIVRAQARGMCCPPPRTW